MIQFEDISLRRGEKVLLDQASYIIHPRQKWGLIGRNGAGKSSLFGLLTGTLSEEEGTLSIPRDWTLAHMKQEVTHVDKLAIDYVLMGDEEYVELAEQLASFEQLAQDNKLNDDQASDWSKALERFEAIDGYRAETKAAKLLDGLGFLKSDTRKRVSEFSGGWRIRLNLAQALMCRSDLLLLDEPTNHLDLEACVWLEEWLKEYPGTLIIISHDRDFLDQVISHVASFENAKIISYTGNYSEYERQRAERLALQQQAFEKQQAAVAHMEDFIRRFKAKASKAKQAQSRVKALEKLERISPAHVDSPFTFEFKSAPESYSALVQLDRSDLGYQTEHERTAVLTKTSFEIQPEQRIGLLGRNGAGKSTLLKSLVGAIPLLNGERRTSERLALGYFAQSQMDVLDIHSDAMTHFRRIDDKASEASLRRFLGSFDFKEDKVFAQISSFSGGEKARLALALIVWQQPNLLVLDEPTNHLDLEMCHAITVALQNYEGALILVSHDRHLIKNTVDRLVIVEGGRVQDYEKSIEDYLAQSLKPVDTRSAIKASNANKANSQQDRKQSAAQRKETAPLRKAIRELEKNLEQSQRKLVKVDADLNDPALYESDEGQLRHVELSKAAQQLRDGIEQIEEQWLALNEQLDQAS